MWILGFDLFLFRLLFVSMFVVFCKRLVVCLLAQLGCISDYDSISCREILMELFLLFVYGFH